MKYLLSLILALLLMGCDGLPNPKTMDEPITVEETSWAYEFVRVENKSYRITNEKADTTFVGEFIGEVRRNIVDRDTDAKFKVENFDANSLKTGTKLYKSLEHANKIIYEIHEGEYFFATEYR